LIIHRLGDSIISRILIATDLSGKTRGALAYAAAVARRFQSSILVAHVLPPVPHFDDPATILRTRTQARRDSQAELEEMRSKAASSGVSTKAILYEANSVPGALLKLAGERRADLIVLGVSASLEGVEGVLSPTVLDIIGRSHCPVLTVKPLWEGRTERHIMFRKIVFVTEYSEDLLDEAFFVLRLADVVDARLSICRLRRPSGTGPTTEEERSAAFTREIRRVEPRRSREWCNPGCVVDHLSSEELSKFAQAVVADLIILNSWTTLEWLRDGGAPLRDLLTRAEGPVMTLR